MIYTLNIDIVYTQKQWEISIVNVVVNLTRGLEFIDDKTICILH